jgi:4-alpha-glucanotransferase
MNTPGTAYGNWRWKLTSGAITEEMESRLAGMARMYRREMEMPENETVDE